MDVVRDAILPLVLIGLLGWLLRRIGLLAPEARLGIEALVYWLLLPALLFTRLARADVDADLVAPLAAGIVLPILAVTAGLAAIRALAAPAWLDDRAFPAVLQGAIRNNTLVSLALAEAVLGETGALYAALAVMLNVPVANLLSIGALLRADAGASRAWSATLLSILRNPFVIAIAAGLLVAALELPLPQPLLRTGEMLSGAVLPLALLVVGAAVSLPSVRAREAALAVALVLRLFAMPLLAWSVCRLAGVGGELALAIVLYHAAPTGTASYVLTRQLGGDGGLMAAIISLQTICAAFTVPLVLLLLAG